MDGWIKHFHIFQRVNIACLYPDKNNIRRKILRSCTKTVIHEWEVFFSNNDSQCFSAKANLLSEILDTSAVFTKQKFMILGRQFQQEYCFKQGNKAKNPKSI